jgi:hypothetical protein
VEKLERGHDRSASVIEILVEDIDRLAREVKDMKTLPPVTKRKILKTKLNYIRYFVAMLTVLLCCTPTLTTTGTFVPVRTPEGTTTRI